MGDLRPDQALRYDDRPDAVIDLHRPGSRLGSTTEVTTLIFLIHGGFWKQEWDRRHTRPMARALADAGYLVATPEYRRVGGDGGWPETGNDVRQAFEMSAELTTGSIIAMGHSAGGQLALWLAGETETLDRVVGLAPVTDLVEAARLHLGQDASQAFMGDQPFAAGDPMTRFETRPTAEIRLVHGTDDELVPPSLSRGFVERHPWVALTEIAGADHFDLIAPESAAWPEVLAALRS